MTGQIVVIVAQKKEQYVKAAYDLDFLLWIFLQNENSTILTKRNRKTYGWLAEAIIQHSTKFRELADTLHKIKIKSRVSGWVIK